MDKTLSNNLKSQDNNLTTIKMTQKEKKRLENCR